MYGLFEFTIYMLSRGVPGEAVDAGEPDAA
jgi:hypothetical protein